MNFSLPFCKNLWTILSGCCMLICCLCSSEAYAQHNGYVQYREFATSETHRITGICINCGIENPERAVGNNELDYATFKIGLALLGGIEQTLIFQHTSIDRFTKVTIGIGTGHTCLSLRLLGQLYVETFSGDTSNNDFQAVDARMLKLLEDSTRGEIEMITTKPYDRVRITLNGGLADINDEFRVYYADQTYGDFSRCDVPHFSSEALYYSFDGNTKELISGVDLNSRLLPVFQDNMACGRQGLSTLPCLENTLQSSLGGWNTGIQGTVGFWARIDDQPYCSGTASLRVEVPPLTITVTIDSITACSAGGCKSYHLEKPRTLNLYVITFQPVVGMPVRLFVNGHEIIAPTVASTLPQPDGHVRISINQAQIDEMIVYKKVLSRFTISDWFYENSPESANTARFPSEENSRLNQHRVTTEENPLRFYPNPTTGKINIAGDILVNDATISVKNTSGKEVCRTRLHTGNFMLPASLPNGVYIITLTTKNNRTYTSKVVLSK
ncbi:MAG TPA: T9SS type A sorting domain-containing protein [Chitinophaga sp.]|uniref:T9SS type A sorting domain-containing protein n=1 Tax=Chitinophaga sp. TaxID=1869181 RepID=UPI002BA4DF19|nr:T9SS type A sorting domain-containing protein [Chitinophaga sp.]HVI45396.1 T9SS type A sorting domain-containing protein [Chitinophaga sp.]